MKIEQWDIGQSDQVHAHEDERARVREYYGRVLAGTQDLRTSACCTSDSLPAEQRAALAQIHPEILERFYGCGSPIPPLLEGCTVLDLGCGTGRDAYIASKLVGPRGRVIGVDMTHSQIEVARRHREEQTRRFGFTSPNVVFVHGYIEDLDSAGVASNSVDVVISNCVLNLSPDKPRVFAEIFRVLKPGGELYFSDVFSARRVPAGLRDDPVLVGECLAGAMYREDFRRLLRANGCLDHRVVSRTPVRIDDPVIHERIGMIDFQSVTVRAFKLGALEDICEDYGQTATYRGTIPENPHRFDLDDHHAFVTGKPMLVCGNTASMLAETRYARHFTVTGDRAVHFGAFDCKPVRDAATDRNGGSACC
ncbi:MAG TPA: methyltransferase domain-containing protein [Candidatus Krumholzibacteria bacterium]|nr:methyltransferase domain-containing protein [Candidatus Krumholzibacteria bacterium]